MAIQKLAIQKVIVTNIGALRAKYGAAGVKAIEAKLKTLIAADKRRGLATAWVALDNKATMKKFRATPVTNAKDPKQNKRAIDGVYAALTPDYLVILGAIDVVPHQNLKNLLYSPPKGDTDEFAYSDLPYACDVPYSQRIKDFTGPTRVVGRLPDLTGATGSPRYLLGLLDTAAKWTSRAPREYQNYLGITAQIWRSSTRESVTTLFHSHKDLQLSPTRGPRWPKGLIGRLAHFINCHGGDTYPDFVGESSANKHDLPISLEASFVAIPRNIAEGTVCVAECCYGGQLYNRAAAKNRQMGMCNTYLERKAYGFFGSTTAAYGPPSGNAQADLICRYFLERVLAGASLGRAALEARQRFVEKALPMSPTNQKTLAQFNLFGDPSIVPVAKVMTRVSVGTMKMDAMDQAERTQRRQLLRAKGIVLAGMQPDMKDITAPAHVVTALHAWAADRKLTHVGARSLELQPAGRSKTRPAHATSFHVLVGAPSAPARASGAKPHPVRRIVILEAKQVGDNVAISEGHSK